MAELPDFVKTDFSKDEKAAREVVEYGMSIHIHRGKERAFMTQLYEDHNGYMRASLKKNITYITGKKSKTPYIRYRLGRSKLKLVHGEFLRSWSEPRIATINREAINEKVENAEQMIGMSYAKPQIEKARELGYNLFSGINIPDKNNVSSFTSAKFKTKNEIIMQGIINDKVRTLNLKSLFHINFVDLSIVSECFGKIEQDANGIDTFRPINPKNSIYLESLNDPLLTRTPIIGEIRYMFLHEIFNTFPELTEIQKTEIIQMCKNPGDSLASEGFKNIENKLALRVATIQWKSIDPRYTKVDKRKDTETPYRNEFSPEYFDKNEKQIRRDVEKGKYDLEQHWQESVWEGSCIYTNLFTKPKKINYVIQTRTATGKYRAKYDYVGYLFSTVDGTRVSLQEMISELENVYDLIRFQVNKELRKIRGSSLLYDLAYLPLHKKFIDVLHEVTDDGIIVYNSSAEGNEGRVDRPGTGDVGIKEVDLGISRALPILLTHAMDIERTLDRITGLNEPRQGLTKATTTATSAMSDLESSRNMTYDLFYGVNIFINEVLSRLAEKTKINWAFLGQDKRALIISDEQYGYLKATKHLSNDDYGSYMTDGRKEKEISEKIESLFLQEINSGSLRSSDAARFWTAESFTEALEVLDNAHNMLIKQQQESAREKTEAQREGVQKQIQAAERNREDIQKHEKELEILKGEIKKEVVEIKELLGIQKERTKAREKATAEPVGSKEEYPGF